MKKVFISRFGGHGDLAPVTSVAKYLKSKGWYVVLGVRDGGPGQRQSEMLLKTPCADMVVDIKEMGPWRTRCVNTPKGWVSVNAILHEYDLVIDYMNIVENNNTSPITKNAPGSEWETSRNSNWVNWADLHFAWAGIDPTKVSDEAKRPVFTLLPGEKDTFKDLKKAHSNLFVIQPYASSLARTWYQANHLPKMLLEAYSNPAICLWDGRENGWKLITKQGASNLQVNGNAPLRASMALIANADLYIGVDTGFTHVAEALNTPHIAIYSTVPAWTRAKYYKHQIPIDMGEKHPEFYTFNLGLGDPLNVIEGLNNLSAREKLVHRIYNERPPLEVACQALSTDPEGLNLEIKALNAKLQSFERIQSKALSLVTPEMVMEKAKKAVPKGLK